MEERKNISIRDLKKGYIYKFTYKDSLKHYYYLGRCQKNGSTISEAVRIYLTGNSSVYKNLSNFSFADKIEKATLDEIELFMKVWNDDLNIDLNYEIY